MPVAGTIALWGTLATLGAADDPAPASTELRFLNPVGGEASTVELRCPGARSLTATGTEVFRFDDVPDGVCTAQVTGATRARFRPVIAGESYRCQAGPKTLYCNAYTEAPAPKPEVPPELRASVQPAGASGSSGDVRVTLAQPNLALWGLVVCPGGARLKAEFELGEARFANVPDEDCVLSLKGGSPVRYSGVQPADHIVCEAAGGATLCRDKAPPRARPKSEATVARPRTASAQPDLPPPAEGVLEVRLTDPSTSSWLYVQCPSGFRERADFKGGLAAISGVPAEACTLSFKGGSPARFAGVSGGQRLTCALSGGIATCE